MTSEDYLYDIAKLKLQGYKLHNVQPRVIKNLYIQFCDMTHSAFWMHVTPERAKEFYEWATTEPVIMEQKRLEAEDKAGKTKNNVCTQELKDGFYRVDNGMLWGLIGEEEVLYKLFKDAYAELR
jgi:hypothetical protein